MKKFMLVATTLVVGILIGAVLAGTVLAAPPTPQGTPTPGVPGFSRSGMMGGFQGRGGMWGGEVGFEDEVLALLNMTREQLIAERQAGKSLVQIAQAKGISEQQLVDTILAAKRAELDQLVRDGKLTQAQADRMYDNMQQAVPQMVNRTGYGPVGGQRGNMPCWDDDDSDGSQPFWPMGPGRGGMRGGRSNGTGR